ncbi:aspartyl-phosphate phosphatase Spo0E family protein [Ammoniphilus sp. YIM 78166]|uniref:aspartyl-phosphate phosphatase Spo0E family protein n=1 Tax=Ammoniphilus sp. YIM 78166 TaxID=1644106 RepID=UPI00106F9B5B|nr:aspartyl-phosphate phosphatase Spo0E family protein [Ammoniphilus sp. YIM 78166]
MYRKKWDRGRATLDSLQAEIDRLRELMYAASARTGSLTHQKVVEISQVIDERILEYQRLKVKSMHKKEII